MVPETGRQVLSRKTRHLPFSSKTWTQPVSPTRRSATANPPFEDTKAYLDARISKLIGEDEKLRGALDLVIISAPEEVEQQIDDLVCTPDQLAIIAKIQHALTHREFLHQHRIHEIGKLLFVGPPGTGKTSLALAMSRTMHMPVLEVRLSMVTSQYLGETSKNIDRIFDLAKKLSPVHPFHR